MTNIEVRKIAWAFADAVSLINDERARTEMVTQVAKRLRFIEKEFFWEPLLVKTLEQCMEVRAKEVLDTVAAAELVLKAEKAPE